jgi:hypothetical protein
MGIELVKRGHLTVAVSNRQVPPLSAEAVASTLARLRRRRKGTPPIPSPRPR